MRECPDKKIYGRFELDMDNHLDLGLDADRAASPGTGFRE